MTCFVRRTLLHVMLLSGTVAAPPMLAAPAPEAGAEAHSVVTPGALQFFNPQFNAPDAKRLRALRAAGQAGHPNSPVGDVSLNPQPEPPSLPFLILQ